MDKTITVNNLLVRVSEHGEVTTLSRKGKNRMLPDTKPTPNVRMGYHRLKIGASYLSAHRIVAKAWLDDYDEALQVDHIDGCRSNNNPSNLRMVTNSQNQMGRVNFSRGSCKYRGVSLYKPSGKYVARICKDKKIMHIGYFDNAEAAAEAYNERAVDLGFFPEALNNLPAQ